LNCSPTASTLTSQEFDLQPEICYNSSIDGTALQQRNPTVSTTHATQLPINYSWRELLNLSTEKGDTNMNEQELLTTLLLCMATNKQPCEVTKQSIIETINGNNLTPLTVIALRKIGGTLQSIATQIERNGFNYAV
jgi:hypothetical protein